MNSNVSSRYPKAAPGSPPLSQQPVSNLLRREARRLPPELLEEIYVRIVERPYNQVVRWLRERFRAASVDPPDLHPIALVLIEAMASYRFMQETFGRVPDGIDDERFITSWVDVALAVGARHGLSTSRNDERDSPRLLR
jgi:hypothetical protein